MINCDTIALTKVKHYTFQGALGELEQRAPYHNHSSKHSLIRCRTTNPPHSLAGHLTCWSGGYRWWKTPVITLEECPLPHRDKHWLPNASVNKPIVCFSSSLSLEWVLMERQNSTCTQTHTYINTHTKALLQCAAFFKETEDLCL